MYDAQIDSTVNVGVSEAEFSCACERWLESMLRELHAPQLRRLRFDAYNYC